MNVQQILRTIGNYKKFANMAFPLDADGLADSQLNEVLLSVLGNIGGNRYYLAEPVAATGYAGFAFLPTNDFPCGELLWIEGNTSAPMQSHLCLVEENVDINASGYSYDGAYTKRRLVHGIDGFGKQSFAKNGFAQLETNVSLKKRVDDLAKKVDPAFYTPIGAIVMWIDGNTTPGDKWLHCDGRFVSKTEYKELYAIIGANRFGADSATEFRLPNMRGRFPVGYDSEDDDYKAVDSTKIGGGKTHTLTSGEQGGFSFSARSDDGDNQGPYPAKSMNGIKIQDHEIVVDGQGAHAWSASKSVSLNNATQGHENRPPYQTLAFIIRVK